jgi:phage FluMu protein Com
MGKDTSEPVIWGELAPFLAMEPGHAVEALAEYIVYQERPGEARTDWLRAIINRALSEATPHDLLPLASFGAANSVLWSNWLNRRPEDFTDLEVNCPSCGYANEYDLADSRRIGSTVLSGEFACDDCDKKIRFRCVMQNPFQPPRIEAWIDAVAEEFARREDGLDFTKEDSGDLDVKCPSCGHTNHYDLADCQWINSMTFSGELVGDQCDKNIRFAGCVENPFQPPRIAKARIAG